MLKEILTDKQFIGKVLRRLVHLIINLSVLVFIGFVIFYFMTEDFGLDFLEYLSVRQIIRTVLALFLFIVVGEILIEYKNRNKR